MKYRREWTCDNHHLLEITFTEVVDEYSSGQTQPSCPVCDAQEQAADAHRKLDQAEGKITELEGSVVELLKAVHKTSDEMAELQGILETPLQVWRDAATAAKTLENLETPAEKDVPF